MTVDLRRVGKLECISIQFLEVRCRWIHASARDECIAYDQPSLALFGNRTKLGNKIDISSLPHYSLELLLLF